MYRTLRDKLQLVLLASLLAGLLTGAIFADRLFMKMELSVLHARAEEGLSQIALSSAGVMRDFVQLSRGVAAAMAADPEMSQEDFNRLARVLFQEYPDARNVAAAPDLVIRYVYPLAGNEQALGLDYRTIPEQFRAVARARDTGEAVIDGPVDLIQGGQGFIARVPVFISNGEDGERFWGLAAGALDAEALYRRAGLLDSGQWLEVSIRRFASGDDSRDYFFGRPELFDENHVDFSLPSSMFSWQFAAAPVAGWTVDPVRQTLFRLALVVAFLLVALPALALLRSQKALTLALAELDITLKAVPETMFEVDGDGRLQDVWADPEELFPTKTSPQTGIALNAIFSADAAAVIEGAVVQVSQGRSVNSRPLAVAGQAGMRHYDMSVSVQPYPKDGRFVVLLRNTTDLRETEMRERVRHAVAEKISIGTPLSDVLEFVAGHLTRQRPELRCAILAADQRTGELRFEAAPELSQESASGMLTILQSQTGGVIDGVLSARRRKIFPDLSKSPEFQPVWQSAAAAGLCACLIEPILGAQGQRLGVVVFFRVNSGDDWSEDADAVDLVTTLAALAIERAQVNDNLRLADIVYRSTSEAMLVTDARNRILAVNPAFTTVTGYTAEEAIGSTPAMLKSGRHNQEFYRVMWAALDGSGTWSGEIWNRRKSGEEYPEWLTINTIRGPDRSVTWRIALFADISEKKKADELIWAQANYDALTKLPNRRLFIDRLEQGIRKAFRDGSLLALLMVDLDRFKEVNDSFGHHFGDQLLIEAAHRIQSCVRASDSVSRLGGDEFTVMMTDLKGSADVDRVTQKILDLLSAPFHIEDTSVYISASIGITLFPDDADTSVDMLKHADQAMYESKRLGRNRYSWFSRSMQEAAQLRMQITADLRQAVERDEFSVVYQPIVEMASGRVVKAEALVRWNHPQRGLVSPASFVPIAEETGLIDEIGFIVFMQATQKAARWRRSFSAGLQVSVNNSPVQFQERYRLHERWIERVTALGLPPEAIVVEVTEGVLMSESLHTRMQLESFQRSGFAIAIDDFGTGYSSLSYLKKFNVDFLKIDRAFVMHLAPGSSDAALCQAIIVMAHTLGLKVIAEGVESQLQHDILLAMGCDYGQGYLYSKPVTPDEFEQLLTKNGGAP